MSRVLETFWVALRLGCSSFGGPVAHIGYFQRSYVEQRQWLSAQEFAAYLAMCQALPGPASSQLGFIIGSHRAGWWGGLAAWLGFTLPSALVLVTAAAALPHLDQAAVGTMVHGLKLVAVAVVAQALLGMAPKLCTAPHTRLIALMSAAIVLLTSSWLGQVLVIMLGAVTGLAFCKAEAPLQTALNPGQSRHSPPLILGLLSLAIGLLVWLSISPEWREFCTIYLRSGGLVFGGGHVVLPLLHQSLVPAELLSNDTFLSGYGLAQAVPGPLFTLASFLGAFSAPEQSFWWGSLVATLAIFAPGLLLAALGLQLWQPLSQQLWFGPVLAGVNAAVVGVLGAAWLSPVVSTSITTPADAAIALLGTGFLLSPWGTPLRVLILILAATLAMSLL